MIFRSILRTRTILVLGLLALLMSHVNVAASSPPAHQIRFRLEDHRHDVRSLAQQVEGLSEETVSVFMQQHHIKENAVLDLTRVEEEDDSNSRTITVHGQTLSLDDLEPVNVYSQDAKFVVDGVEQDLPPISTAHEFYGQLEDGTRYMVTKDDNGQIETIDIVTLDGSYTYLAAIAPGTMATIRAESMDQEYLGQCTVGHIDNHKHAQDASRHLSSLMHTMSTTATSLWTAAESTPQEDQHDNEGQHHRRLQDEDEGCTSFATIEVAAAFDSTLCAVEGSASAVRQTIENAFARASLMYEAQNVCTQLRISYLDGFCSASSDPYRAGINTNDIGCSNNNDVGLIQVFEDYWETTLGSVRRDAAHLFFGRALGSGQTVGCASVQSLCDGSYGVNDFRFSADPILRASLFAHELGHNVGLNHVRSSSRGPNYIMDGGGGTIQTLDFVWSSTSLRGLSRLLPSHSCVANGQAAAGAAPPPGLCCGLSTLGAML